MNSLYSGAMSVQDAHAYAYGIANRPVITGAPVKFTTGPSLRPPVYDVFVRSHKRIGAIYSYTCEAATDAFKQEVEEWCAANGRFKIHNTDKEFRVSPRTKADAVMFKLRWVNV